MARRECSIAIERRRRRGREHSTVVVGGGSRGVRMHRCAVVVNRRRLSTLHVIVEHGDVVVVGNVERDSVAEHCLVKVEVEATCSQRGQLTQHNVLCYSLKVIVLREDSSIHQDFHSLLKRATHHGTRVYTIDTVTSNGHQVTTICHHISKSSKMAIVDIRTIKRNNSSEFLEESISHSLNTKHLNDFDDIVGNGARVVDIRETHNLQKIDSFSIENPLIFSCKATILVKYHPLFFTHENLANGGDSTK